MNHLKSHSTSRRPFVLSLARPGFFAIMIGLCLAVLFGASSLFAGELKDLRCVTESMMSSDVGAECTRALELRDIAPVVNISRVCHGVRPETGQGVLILTSRREDGTHEEEIYVASSSITIITSRGAGFWGERSYRNDKGDVLSVEEWGRLGEPLSHVTARKPGVGILFWAHFGEPQ